MIRDKKLDNIQHDSGSFETQKNIFIGTILKTTFK